MFNTSTFSINTG